MIILHFHNSYHLGDNVFNLILFYMIKDIILINNIKIFYYAKKDYLPQLKEFISCKNIFLSSLNYKPKDSIELWINNPIFDYNYDTVINIKNPYCFNEFYKKFFTIVLNKFNIKLKLLKFYYKDTDLLTRYNNIPDKYKKFDILILNSQPGSGQYNYNKNEWDEYILLLNSKFNILTTTKVCNLLSTTDDNLTIKDIASLSTKAKVIIAINSGVVPGLLNYYTLTNIKHFYTFDNNNYYSYPNFERKQNIKDITIQELQSYIT